MSNKGVWNPFWKSILIFCPSIVYLGSTLFLTSSKTFDKGQKANSVVKSYFCYSPELFWPRQVKIMLEIYIKDRAVPSWTFTRCLKKIIVYLVKLLFHFIRINPIPTRLRHVIYCCSDKIYPCLVGIGLRIGMQLQKLVHLHVQFLCHKDQAFFSLCHFF